MVQESQKTTVFEDKITFRPPFKLSDVHAQAGMPVENQFGIVDSMSELLSFNGLGKPKAGLV